MRIGHVHLKVRNLHRAINFYRDYLGLQITEQLAGSLAFLSSSEMHHEIALQQVGEEAAQPGRFAVGLYHVGFEVPNRQALAATYRRLVEGGITVYPIDHRISWALYFSDPDGNGIEVYWDTRGTGHGVQRWEGVDRPLTAVQLGGRAGNK